jgi:HAD superfamily hydrolase (TIGR01509 family)
MYRLHVAFIDGFLAFHAVVSARGLARCVATASDPVLLAIAKERLDLDSLFPDGIFTIAQVENRSKPDPAIYRFAVAQLGVPPSECLAIEDAPDGITAAKAAGVRCIGIATTVAAHHLRAADAVVSSFAEIDLDHYR